MALTFVTGIFDLPRREPAYTARTLTEVLDMGRRWLLAEPVPLVIHADPELAAAVAEARSGLERLTLVVPAPLESLAPWGRLDLVRRCRRASPLTNGNPRKDVPGYTVLGWCKFDLLERVARDDPFGNAHAAWIDFGIGHVAVPPPGGLAAVAAAPTERVSVCSLRWAPARDVEDRREHCRWIRGLACAGFFGGGRHDVLRLVEAARAEIEACLAAGVAPSDEHVLSALLARRGGELFRPYHGDYQDILRNYDRVRGGHALVRASAEGAARAGDAAAAAAIGSALLGTPLEQDVGFWLWLFETAWEAGRLDVCRALAAVAEADGLALGMRLDQRLKVAVARRRIGRATG